MTNGTIYLNVKPGMLLKCWYYKDLKTLNKFNSLHRVYWIQIANGKNNDFNNKLKSKTNQKSKRKRLKAINTKREAVVIV